MRCSVDAIVTSRTGSASAPSRTIEAVGADREVAAHRVGAGVEPADRLHVERRRATDARISSGVELTRYEVQRAGADAGRRLEPAAHRGAGRAPRRPGARCTRCAGTASRRPPSMSSTRRVGTPSASWVAAPNASASVGSSTRVMRGRRRPPRRRDRRTSNGPSGSPRRSSAPPRSAEQRAGDQRVEDDRQPRATAVCVAPSSRTARSAASRAASSTSSSAKRAPGREAAAGLGGGALARHRERGARAHRAPGRRLDAERVRDRGLDRGVAVATPTPPRARAGRRAASPRSSSSASATLSAVGVRQHVVAPEVERGRRRRPRRRRASRARSASSGAPKAALSRASASGLGDDVGVERARPRVALAAVDDHADADAVDLGDRQRLDLAVEHLDVDVARAHHVGLDLLARHGRRRPRAAATARGGRRQSPAVPPTVSSATRSVGWPDDTGTPWPSLPHVPAQVSKS